MALCFMCVSVPFEARGWILCLHLAGLLHFLFSIFINCWLGKVEGFGSGSPPSHRLAAPSLFFIGVLLIGSIVLVLNIQHEDLIHAFIMNRC